VDANILAASPLEATRWLVAEGVAAISGNNALSIASATPHTTHKKYIGIK
jgi:hypothetical protein